MWRLIAALVLTLVATACAVSAPLPVRTLAEGQRGRIVFESHDGTVIDGTLNLPGKPGPLPAVVLLHGCSGATETISGWERALLSWSFATFSVDSLQGRGVSETCTRPRVSVGERVLDAHAARRLLLTHPRIDASRIVLMGFSHGGTTALRLAGQWAAFRSGDRLPAEGAPFQAYVLFYPACNTWLGDLSRAGAPIRIHVGELDDWTPAKWCVRIADALRDGGADVEVTVYAGAHHSFDNVGVPLQFLPRVLNYGDCESPSAQKCVKRGAKAGYNASATAKARQNVRHQLEALSNTRDR